MAFLCNKCQQAFTRLNNMKRHRLRCGAAEKQTYRCPDCRKEFSRAHDVTRHVRMIHGEGGGLSAKAKAIEKPTFEIMSEYKKSTKKFHLTSQSVVFKITEPPKGFDLLKWVKKAIGDIVQYTVAGVEPNDKIGMTFDCDSFKQGCGYMSFRKANEVTMEDVWDILGKIFQSNAEGLIIDTFRLKVTHVKTPVGRGRRIPSNKYNSFEEESRYRRGIIQINNTDYLCLPRALVVAKAYVKKVPNFKQICNGKKLQDVKVQKLLKKIEISLSDNGAGIPELQKFQSHLRKYQIIVYEYGFKGRNVIFEGYNPDALYKINLLHHKQHYNVITSLTAAFSCSYYCETCHMPYDHKDKHRCIATCPCCQYQTPCKKTEKSLLCSSCNRYFRSQQCFLNHKQFSICELIRRCKECFKTVKRDREHQCGETFCKICKQYCQANHECYIQVDTRKPKLTDVLFVFFDLETRQEMLTRDGDKVHEPNLCVFMQRCDQCIMYGNAVTVCQKCGVRREVLQNNPIKSFMEFVLNQKKLFRQVVCIAHNGQGFDHQFILKYILEETKHKPNLIMRGSKIILIGMANVKFIDSINYFPMALAKLPKAFDLGQEMKKGYFPHLFNTQQNANYVGVLPDIKFYQPNAMMPEERKTFLKWYEEHKNDQFNMQRDLVEYCVSDVDILTKACIKFREMFLEQCGVCPFTEACTIASACNLTFRRQFLKPQTIAIIPKNGYRCKDNQSKIAIQWLLWEEKERDINICHAAKQKEVIIYGHKVDGFCERTRQVFEFHGCYFHGHDVCFTTKRDEPLHEDPLDTLNNRFERTKAKIQKLQELGYDVVEKWECDFRRELMSNKNIEVYTLNHPLLQYTPLNGRDSFFGGRTGNTKTYYHVKPDENIKYVDVCSLYPFICVNGKFPIGHPEIFVGDECQKLNILEIDGLVKCKVLPPQDLYHPVLPLKANNKLLFSLCRTCASTLNQTECTHTEEDRALTGTWVVDELRTALQKGYRLLNVYEIWKYETDQYDSCKKSGGLFTEMMNKFIKIKQEASGWPSDCVTEESRNKFVEECFVKEGVKLESTKIVKNSGLRSLAKLILNSFWGKFGQRENQPKTSIYNESKELFDILSNPCIIVNYIQEVNEEVVVVNWEYRDEAIDPLSTVNVAVASYVTAQARLKLYSYLEQLGERVLYYDTDSVIYISKPGVADLPTGNFLGDLTNELDEYGKDSYITEFVSGGPKNYAYKVFSPSTNKESIICKVKGIRLNYEAEQLINFNTIKTMILSGETDNKISIVSDNIRRTENHTVLTTKNTKLYRPNSTKRRFLQNFDSLPYGYKRFCTGDL